MTRGPGFPVTLATPDTGDQLAEVASLIDLAMVQQMTGDYPAAAARVAEAMELFRDLDAQRTSTGAGRDRP